jgi:hypothetical protein
MDSVIPEDLTYAVPTMEEKTNNEARAMSVINSLMFMELFIHQR